MWSSRASQQAAPGRSARTLDLTRTTVVLHPKQFEVNEAWVAFKLNDAPLRTDADGDLNCIALMDAASCCILGNMFVPVQDAEPSKMAVLRLLTESQAHKQQLPKTLFVPSEQFNTSLPAEAERQGITVVRVPEDQLLLFIGEARKRFKEHFWAGGVQ